MNGTSWLRDLGLLLAIGLTAAAGAMVLSGRSAPELVLLAVFCGVGIATLRFPMIGLSALIVIVISNLSQNLIVEYGAPSVAKLAAPGLMAILIARYLYRGERPYVGWLAISLLATFLGLRLIGATYALDWALSLQSASDFVKDATVAVLALAFMHHARGFGTVTVTATLTVAAICGLGAWHFIAGDLPEPLRIFAWITPNSGRFSGPIEDANFFAAIIVFTVPLGLFRMLNARGAASGLFWAVVSGLLIFGLLATQSRGGILALGVGMAMLVVGMTGRQIAIGGVVALVALLVVSAIVSDQLIERLGTITEVITSEGDVLDESTEGRLASWQVAFEIFKDNPWLGVGAGNFNLLYQDLALEMGLIFRGEGRSTHSLYLEILTEQGLVGLTFFLGMLGAAALSIRSAAAAAVHAGHDRLARHYSAFGAGLAGYLSAMAFLQDSYPRFLWIVIVVAIELGRIARATLPAGAPEPLVLLPSRRIAPLILLPSRRLPPVPAE